MKKIIYRIKATGKISHDGDYDEYFRRCIKMSEKELLENIAEFNRKDLADGEDDAFACKDHHRRLYFKADADGYQQYPHQTQQPLLPIRVIGDPLDRPHAKICKIPEEKCNRQLHKLDRVIFFPQYQNLQENKHAVHNDRRSPHCKRSK